MLPLILAILLALSAFGQSAKPTANTPAKKSPPAQGTTAEEDKKIEAAIRAKLDKSKIGKDGFKVHVQGGVATWEGSTNVLQHKGAATRMAKAAGAIQVVNNIKVTGGGAGPGKPGGAGPPRHVQVKTATSPDEP